MKPRRSDQPRKFLYLVGTVHFWRTDKTKGSGLGWINGEVIRTIRVSLTRFVDTAFLALSSPSLLRTTSSFLLVQGEHLPSGRFMACFREEGGAGGGQSDISTSAVFSDSFSLTIFSMPRWHILGYHVLNPITSKVDVRRATSRAHHEH